MLTPEPSWLDSQSVAQALFTHGLIDSPNASAESVEAALVRLYGCRRADLRSGKFHPDAAQIETLLRARRLLQATMALGLAAGFPRY